MELNQEIKDLFELARLKLGGGIRKVEVTDDALCACLDIALRDYNQFVLDFVIDNNWSNFYGKKISNTDLAFAFSVRTFDMSKEYSDYFSKYVGLQQHGTKWELKKDYFEIVQGQQVYTIPAGREISKILFITPPTTDVAKVAAWYGGIPYGVPGLGGAQMALGAFAGMTGMWGWAGFPLYDVALTAVDFKEKNKWLQGDFCYRVTAGPNSTHLVHLLSTPGSPFSRMGGFGRLANEGCYCWYYYYDVNPGEESDCANANPDVYLSPDQVKLESRNFGLLNDSAKNVVRRLFVAEVCETLGFVLGKFNGEIRMVNAPLTLNFSIFLDAARRDKENAINELKERLQRMTPNEVLKREAEMADNIKKIRGMVPLKLIVR